MFFGFESGVLQNGSGISSIGSRLPCNTVVSPIKVRHKTVCALLPRDPV